MNQKGIEMIRDALRSYHIDPETGLHNPYHNPFHACETYYYKMLMLDILGASPEEKGLAGFITISHDISNLSIARPYIDEYNAAESTARVLYEDDLQRMGDRAMNDILETPLGERGLAKTKTGERLTDADIGSVGSLYPNFIKNSIRVMFEEKPDDITMTPEYIISSFKKTLNNFLPFILERSGTDSPTPFLSKEANIILPHFDENRDLLQQDIEDYPERLIQAVKYEWMRHYGVPLLIGGTSNDNIISPIFDNKAPSREFYKDNHLAA